MSILFGSFVFMAVLAGLTGVKDVINKNDTPLMVISALCAGIAAAMAYGM